MGVGDEQVAVGTLGREAAHQRVEAPDESVGVEALAAGVGQEHQAVVVDQRLAERAAAGENGSQVPAGRDAQRDVEVAEAPVEIHQRGVASEPSPLQREVDGEERLADAALAARHRDQRRALGDRLLCRRDGNLGLGRGLRLVVGAEETAPAPARRERAQELGRLVFADESGGRGSGGSRPG